MARWRGTTTQRGYMTIRQAMAALHWPGYLEIGEPDVAARHAELGTEYLVHVDYGYAARDDDWDWTHGALARNDNR